MEYKENLIPEIVVSVTGETMDELIDQASEAVDSAAQIIEWRADFFKDIHNSDEVLDVLSKMKYVLKDKKLLFTFRTIEEGGQTPISLKEYQTLCSDAAKSGFIDIIDIELEKAEFLGREFIQKIKENPVKLLLSSHDFSKTPEDAVLVLRIGVMNQFGADMGKIAVMPHNLQDVLRMMGIIAKARGFNQLPLAVISMGELGKISRISGSLTGSALTFASLQTASAPGQIPVERMPDYLAELQLQE